MYPHFNNYIFTAGQCIGMKIFPYRSISDRWIAGVCGGIAKYIKIPSILVRLLFVSLCFIIPPFSVVLGILIYIALIFILPTVPMRETTKDTVVIEAEFKVRE